MKTDWEGLLAGYRAAVEAMGWTPSTRARVEAWTLLFCQLCRQLGAEHPGQLVPRHLEEFRQHLLWTPGPGGRLYSAHTVYQGLQMVRAWLRWAAAAGLLARDPTEDLVLPAPFRSRPLLPTRREVELLFLTPDPSRPLGLRDRAILMSFYLLGLSKAVCSRLDRDDLDLLAGKLQIPSREVELPGRLVEAFDRYLHLARPVLYRRPQAALFLGRHGRRLQPPALLWMVKLHARAAGLPGLDTRRLRQAYHAHVEEFCAPRIGTGNR